MSKYENLDAMILESIGDGTKSFSDIFFGGRGTKNLRPLCESFSTDKAEAARVLDRRLQALRKKGLIVFMKGWRKVS